MAHAVERAWEMGSKIADMMRQFRTPVFGCTAIMRGTTVTEADPPTGRGPRPSEGRGGLYGSQNVWVIARLSTVSLDHRDEFGKMVLVRCSHNLAQLFPMLFGDYERIVTG